MGNVSGQTVTAQAQWSTYLGGAADDQVYSITTDDFGHVYVAGRTTDSLRLGNDTTGQSGLTHQRNFGGGTSDAFLAKFAPQGSMLWCTYFGGSGDDAAVAVVTLGMEGVYLVGNTTSPDSIASDTLAYQAAPGGGTDMFIAHFTEYGLLVGATYFGGTDEEIAAGAVLDVHGRLMVAGRTNGPECLNGIEPAAQSYTLGNDGLLLLFRGTHTLVAGTFLGGEGEDALVQIASGDSTGTVFVGNTTSTMNIAMIGAMTPTRPGGADAFFMKVDTTLTIQYGSYFGGTGDEVISGVAQRAGRVAICGSTTSDSLHVDSTFQVGTHAGGVDAFIAVFNDSLALQWCRFVGDTADDALTAVSFDVAGNVYASGLTSSNTGISTSNGEGAQLNGTSDAFVMRFDSASTMTWARYVGGLNEDEAQAIRVFGNTAIFLGGRTNSPDVALVGHQMQHGGGTWDGFTTRLDQETSTEPSGICTGTSTSYSGGSGGSSGSCNGVSPPLIQFDVCLGNSVSFMAYGGALGNGAEWMWYKDQCGIPEYFLTSGDTITITPTASFILKVRAEGPNSWTNCRSLPIVVHLPPSPTVSVSDTVCAGAPIELEGSGAESFTWLIADSTYTGSVLTVPAPFAPGPLPVKVTASSGPVCSVVLQDTVLVLAPPIATWSTTDITCAGGNDGSLMLDSTSTALAEITWSPAEYSGTTLVNLAEGTYINTVTDVFGCSSTDTLTITMPVVLMDSISIAHAPCGAALGKAEVHSSSSAEGLRFDWGDGPVPFTTAESFLPGSYTVTATDSAGCLEQMSFHINAIGTLQISIAVDTVYAPDGETTLTSTVIPLDSTATYLWSPTTGLEDPMATTTLCTLTELTTYTITATSAMGCTSSYSVVVSPVITMPPTLTDPCGEGFLPDIFSPNGDGLNDALCLLGGCFTSVSLHVYDRWGQRVFFTGTAETCWDGTLNGSPLPPGAYAFTLAAERSTGDILEHSGHITLKR